VTYGRNSGVSWYSSEDLDDLIVGWQHEKSGTYFVALLLPKMFRLINPSQYFSALQPIFQKHNVKLVGVGLEQLGVDEFVEGQFFSGGTKLLLLLVSKLISKNIYLRFRAVY